MNKNKIVQANKKQDDDDNQLTEVMRVSKRELHETFQEYQEGIKELVEKTAYAQAERDIMNEENRTLKDEIKSLRSENNLMKSQKMKDASKMKIEKQFDREDVNKKINALREKIKKQLREGQQ
jgi:predicted DNA-binding protein (UPF0278 family)